MLWYVCSYSFIPVIRLTTWTFQFWKLFFFFYSSFQSCKLFIHISRYHHNNLEEKCCFRSVLYCDCTPILCIFLSLSVKPFFFFSFFKIQKINTFCPINGLISKFRNLNSYFIWNLGDYYQTMNIKAKVNTVSISLTRKEEGN